eukprot:TRINITY_DN2555_c0_g1_i1.p1 TRINITY_DN2555_c0_g1~~TRINITY_DN2555_c0_g1_i1.p1  ORF type:complete len:176 (-),score=44.68 TRINITY_DN2555_c0_g1_i1:30-485(-)
MELQATLHGIFGFTNFLTMKTHQAKFVTLAADGHLRIKANQETTKCLHELKCQEVRKVDVVAANPYCEFCVGPAGRRAVPGSQVGGTGKDDVPAAHFYPLELQFTNSVGEVRTIYLALMSEAEREKWMSGLVSHGAKVTDGVGSIPSKFYH